MSNLKTETKKECLERLHLSNNPTLIIGQNLINKINYLHSKVGKVEWSGELITREEGTINDLDDWKIIAEDIFLTDIGTGAFTGYEVGKGSFKPEDIIKMYDKYPGLLEGTHKLQHIHTHHSMGCFFSGTDWEQLEDRADVSNYFLMLIVNFDGDWCSKVAFKAKKENKSAIKLQFSNNVEERSPLVLKEKKDNELLVVMDCKLEIEQPLVDASFIERYEYVKTVKQKEEEEKKKMSSNKLNSGGSKWKQPLLGDDVWGDGSQKIWNGSTNGADDYSLVGGVWKKDKKISQMTDKEWIKWEQEQQARDVFLRDQQEEFKFEIRHARAFLNSIILGTYMDSDFTDPIKKLDEQISTFVKNSDDPVKYAEEFGELLQEHFDVLHVYKNQNDYLNLLKETILFLKPYKKHHELIPLLIEQLDIEIELYKEPVI